MRFIATTSAILLLTSTNALSFLDNGVQTLAYSANSNIQFSKTLPCGACVRSGNAFCMTPSSFAANKQNSTCCQSSDAACALDAVANNMACGTTNT